MVRRAFGLAAVIALIGGGLWVYRYLDRTLFGSSGPIGPLVTVRIPQGSGVGNIGDILDAAGVVSNGQAWALKVRINGDGDQFQPGTYRLHRNEPYAVIVRSLSDGPPASHVVTRKLTVPEGLRISEIARLAPKVGISRKSYLAAVHRARPPAGFKPTGKERLEMEGFLFPATFDVRQPPTANRLVGQQLDAFAAAIRKIDFTYATKKHLTRYDVVIIASLIEREARYPGDRAKIAAVIYNRLHRHMPLGIDATVQYAAGSWRVPTAADLKHAGPYSRDRPGLPPTAISNPGLASLRAAAHPAKVPYLYYVAIPHDRKGRHFFTASYAKFKQYQAEHPAG